MDLILWRHAQAEAKDPATQVDAAADMARRLTPKGERQAERMAAWLSQRLPSGVKVLTSPAVRTVQTAQALGLPYKTVEALGPDAPVDGLLKAARWPAAKDAVLIVGHQPTLGLLASRLLTGAELPWSLRKGAVWWLRGRESEGQLDVTLLAVQSPDLL